jgi:hypothetical protein
MEPNNFGRVADWFGKLPDDRKIAWASPDSVHKHCPVFAAAEAETAELPQTARPNARAQLDQKDQQIHELSKQLGTKDRRIKELEEKLAQAGAVITFKEHPREAADAIVANVPAIWATDLASEIPNALARKRTKKQK